MSQPISLFMRNRGLKIFSVLSVLVGALAGSPDAKAQRYVTLVDWNQSWQYVESGVELGTAWRTNTYNDAVAPWLTGQGILANETAAYPAPFLTTLSFGPQPQVNNTTNYYFRTHFTYYASNFVSPLTLWASNAVDDGCVVYLNGIEAGRIRVATGQNAATYASGTIVDPEGTIEPFQINTNLLRVGDNVLAVEVHQVNATSTDIAFGLKVAAIVPTLVVFTTQPQSTNVIQGTPVTLSVTPTGGPASFQWQTNNGAGVYVNIAGATSTSYSTTPNSSGATSYRIIASNGAGSVTSSVATVTVTVDNTGPLVLSAIVDTVLTNRIDLTFDETLYAFGTTSTVASAVSPGILTNGTFRVVMFGSNVNATVNSSSYNSGGPGVLPKVSLFMGTNNWFYKSNYYIVLNNIRDFRTNIIAPNTIVPLSWPMIFNTNVFTPDNQYWTYYNNWFNDRCPNGVFLTPPYDCIPPLGPDVYLSNWWQTTYNDVTPVAWAGPANNILYLDLEGTNESCFVGTPLNDISYQVQPTLLRTWFMWPTNLSTNVNLKFEYAADDAAAYYLNGDFLFKDASFPAGAITSDTRATAGIEAVCKTNTINGVALRPGSNLIAVAVAQYQPNPLSDPADFVFALQLEASSVSYQTSPLPPWSRTNVITLTKLASGSSPTNNFRISWATNAYGYALERAVNVTGPWSQVQPHMANPYITNGTGGSRFFYRLHATQ
jgi:hypothetical protein